MASDLGLEQTRARVINFQLVCVHITIALELLCGDMQTWTQNNAFIK